MKPITHEWITKAENDFIVATRELNAFPAVMDAVCFHSQQCIEKYLKAILQENEFEFEKIHDLVALMSQCIQYLPELKIYREDLIRLTSYAVESRYPGLTISDEEGRTCVKTMNTVRDNIRRYFKL